jgi:4-carboxymuconolactone decarboxylase
VYEATRRILDTGTLDAQEYEKYAAVLSVAHLFELVTLIGYYSMLAAQLSVFDIQPPAPSSDSQEGITK